MLFSEVVGQKELKEQLSKLARDGKVPHAIMFCEEPGYGALPLAVALARYMCCKEKNGGLDSCGSCPSCNKFNKLIHPDMHFAFPVNATKSVVAEKKPVSDHFISEWRDAVIKDPYITEEGWYSTIELENKSGMIGVAEASQILRKLSMRSFEGGDKFMFVWLPEKMNQEASNKLLKLIEEPPAGTYIFLVSQSPERVILTITSRCRLVRVPPIDAESHIMELMSEFDLDSNEAAFWHRLSGGSLSRARKLIEGGEKSSEHDKNLMLLMNGCASKDLKKIILFWEDISATTRENQRIFCEYLLEFFRQAMLVSAGAQAISDTHPSKKEFINFWAGKIRGTFYLKASEAIDKALSDINRNVNSKYIFADLSNRFFLSL